MHEKIYEKTGQTNGCQRMPELGRLVETVRDRYVSKSRGYECGACSLSFDREPLNCPACGCSIIQESS